MKLKDYIKKLQRIVDKNPEAAELPVVYGVDDGGNGFRQITYDPAAGTLADDAFTAHTPEPNAVCLN